MGEVGGAGAELGPTCSHQLDCKELKIKGKLPNKVEAFSLAKNHLLFCFRLEERDSIIDGDPWVVASQLLAIKSWVPDCAGNQYCQEDHYVVAPPKPSH